MLTLFRSLRWLMLTCLFVYGLSFIPAVRNAVVQASGPVVRGFRLAGESVVHSAQLVLSIGTVAKENGELRAKVNELTALQTVNSELKHENELLRRELSLTNSGQTLIAAQVISRSSSVSQQSILVNKGIEAGFTEGMAVIAQGYFVGRVEEALPQTSRIRLITSAESLIPVVLQNTRSLGLLKGGAAGLIIDEIPRDVSISSGEAIVTANIGDVVKSGLPIGTVSIVLSGQSDVFQSARVASPIDFSRLEVVFGVK